MRRKRKLLVLTAVLMAFVAVGNSYGAEYRKDIHVTRQHIAEFIPGAMASLERHPREFERCIAFEREIEVISARELPVVDSPLYNAPSIEGMAQRFRRVEVLTHRQRGCERRERQRAVRRIALTECVREVTERYGVSRPLAAPLAVKAVFCAAGHIDDTPYIWGGGHGSFESAGYDCSGAVSYALHGGRFLEGPLTSGNLAGWGEPGPGRWITVYANAGHVWMTIGGLTFDTSGGDGPRWHASMVNSPEGFVARHPGGY